MYLHAETWGHVALTTPLTAAMECAEEANELLMLRCRHNAGFSRRLHTSLCGFLLSGKSPSTNELICNPGTLSDIAGIFRARV